MTGVGSLLAREIDAYYDGFPHARALLDAARAAELLVPLDAGGRPLCLSKRGLTWVCAFTGADRLARFARARDEGAREWRYARVPGARLLDGTWASGTDGVAVDLGGRRPMLLPTGATTP